MTIVFNGGYVKEIKFSFTKSIEELAEELAVDLNEKEIEE